MNQILRYDWLQQRARWRYLARSRLSCVPEENSALFPHNESFIYQACSVKIAGHWPWSFFFCMFMDLDSILVHKDG